MSRFPQIIHYAVASDAFPYGVSLACNFCDYKVKITTEKTGYYLKNGWPKHHGETMWLTNLKAETQEDAHENNTV